MAFTNRVPDGGDILLSIGGEILMCATTHSIEISNSVREISCKGSGSWTSAEYGRNSWTMSADALFNLYTEAGKTGYPALVAAMENKTLVTLLIEYDEASDTFTQTGEAIVASISRNDGDAENSSYSVTFTGRGALTTTKTEV